MLTDVTYMTNFNRISSSVSTLKVYLQGSSDGQRLALELYTNIQRFNHSSKRLPDYVAISKFLSDLIPRLKTLINKPGFSSASKLYIQNFMANFNYIDKQYKEYIYINNKILKNFDTNIQQISDALLKGNKFVANIPAITNTKSIERNVIVGVIHNVDATDLNHVIDTINHEGDANWIKGALVTNSDGTKTQKWTHKVVVRQTYKYNFIDADYNNVRFSSLEAFDNWPLQTGITQNYEEVSRTQETIVGNNHVITITFRHKTQSKQIPIYETYKDINGVFNQIGQVGVISQVTDLVTNAITYENPQLVSPHVKSPHVKGTLSTLDGTNFNGLQAKSNFILTSINKVGISPKEAINIVTESAIIPFSYFVNDVKQTLTLQFNKINSNFLNMNQVTNKKGFLLGAHAGWQVISYTNQGLVLEDEVTDPNWVITYRVDFANKEIHITEKHKITQTIINIVETLDGQKVGQYGEVTKNHDEVLNTDTYTNLNFNGTNVVGTLTTIDGIHFSGLSVNSNQFGLNTISNTGTFIIVPVITYPSINIQVIDYNKGSLSSANAKQPLATISGNINTKTNTFIWSSSSQSLQSKYNVEVIKSQNIYSLKISLKSSGLIHKYDIIGGIYNTNTNLGITNKNTGETKIITNNFENNLNTIANSLNNISNQNKHGDSVVIKL